MNNRVITESAASFRDVGQQDRTTVWRSTAWDALGRVRL